MFDKHPSKKLNQLFGEKPYQGTEPESSEFLFIGLDANYGADIERHSVFPFVVEYHADGVLFWERHGVHHPFLLAAYSGDGRRYHRNFARIGFTSVHAANISFIELLHVPTVGRNKLSCLDFDPFHLRRVEACMMDGSARHIFVSAGVSRLMRETGLFKWLPVKPIEKRGSLGVLFHEGDKTIYSHLHFSNYGKFEQQMRDEARAIFALMT